MSITDVIANHVELAPFTTLGLGGRARYFATVTSVEQIIACLDWAARHALPVHVLGGGSNTVFADGGFPGLVLHMGITGCHWENAKDRVLAHVQAGETWDAFVQAAVDRGLAGVECLSGIPGQVGASPIQNVGAYGQEICQTLVQVSVLDRHTWRSSHIDAADCGFAYRWSRFKGPDRDRFIILAGTFSLGCDGRPQVDSAELARRLGAPSGTKTPPPGPETLAWIRECVLDLRRSKSMVVDTRDPESRSAGSFFLNPVLDAAGLAALRSRCADPGAVPAFEVSGGFRVPAAWLVEHAGFQRGYARDGVGVSARHALALVNRGGSTAALLCLADDIKAAVHRCFGVHLQREPVVVTG